MRGNGVLLPKVWTYIRFPQQENKISLPIKDLRTKDLLKTTKETPKGSKEKNPLNGNCGIQNPPKGD